MREGCGSRHPRQPETSNNARTHSATTTYTNHAKPSKMLVSTAVISCRDHWLLRISNRPIAASGRVGERCHNQGHCRRGLVADQLQSGNLVYATDIRTVTSETSFPLFTLCSIVSRPVFGPLGAYTTPRYQMSPKTHP